MALSSKRKWNQSYGVLRGKTCDMHKKYISSRLKAINVFNYIFRSQKTSNPSEKIYLKIYSNGKEMRFDDKQ